MVSAALPLSVSRELKTKGFYENKIKQQPQFKTINPESTDVRKVLVKADRHPAVALVDLQTHNGDLSNSKFFHFYSISTKVGEKEIITSVIKGSQETINEACTIQLDWIR